MGDHANDVGNSAVSAATESTSAVPADTRRRKHEELVSRLSLRERPAVCHARQDESFLSEFASSTKHVDGLLDGLMAATGKQTSDTSPSQVIASATAQIERLQSSLNNSASLLPVHDLRRSQQTLDQLQSKLSLVANKVTPPKVFSFKSKPASRLPPPVISPVEPLATVTSVTPSPKNGFFNLEGQTLQQISSCSTNCRQDFSLDNLKRCKVFVLQQYVALRIACLHNCWVFCAPVAGSIHVENCSNCVLCFAGRQIRIHGTTNCKLFVFAKTNPIIENSSQLIFAPYCFDFEGKEGLFKACEFEESANRFSSVEDFNWLVGGPSPNWTISESHTTVTHNPTSTPDVPIEIELPDP
ncbi:tubulin-specific chaperone C [Pelomyxa schiedti]|nr:tubulin-specific chaperone C [Pelomyxa schiedti]